MKKIGIITLLIFVNFSFCIAQDLKKAAEQKKQQEIQGKKLRDAELQEKARLLKAQLSLDDLLYLLKSKDLEDVDKSLTSRGWKFEGTNIDEDGDMPDDYEMVKWSLDKDEYTGLAKGFFYFYRYTKYDNAISYRMANEEHLERLEKDLKTKGYKKSQSTDAITRGLESTYRNNQYEVVFRKVKKRENEKGAEIRYEFFIYNYKEIEKQREEAERIERETKEQAEKLEREAKELEQNYQNAMEAAKENFEQRKYEQAIEDYQNALNIKPANANLINPKIEEINKMLLFLKERQHKIYNYNDYYTSDYETKNNIIISDLKTILSSEKLLSFATITITATIDTTGFTKTTITSAGLNEKLLEKLNQTAHKITLKQPLLNGYTLSAAAVFNYTVSAEEAIIKVKNKESVVTSKAPQFNTYHSNIKKTLSSAPKGTFTFQCNSFSINNKDYLEDKLLKFKGSGGPENALLSLLVPGLGDHRVSYGKRKGIGIAVSTYALAGVAIGCKLYSVSEYKKYHAATEQSDMDEHYKNANYSNQAFIVSVCAGGAVWLSDIIWVLVKGAKNNKEQKVWKQSQVGFYYMPNMDVKGLTYTLKF